MAPSPGALILGTITIGALLAAESAQRETYGETVGAVVITMVLYWLAHSYADFAARRLRESKPLEFSELLSTMASELWILAGVAIPLLALLIGWAAGAALTTSVSVAIWTSAAMILVIEVVSGVRAGETGHELVLQTALGTVLGALVIVLRVVLH
jgi:hypothetical protein